MNFSINGKTIKNFNYARNLVLESFILVMDSITKHGFPICILHIESLNNIKGESFIIVRWILDFFKMFRL